MLMVPEKRLAVQAYEQLLDMIMGGALKPGALIHERRLAEALAMSRTPLRDALTMLEGEGLVERAGAKGLQVRRLDLDDFLEALAIRRLLEPDAAAAAAGKLAPTLIDSLVARLEELLRRRRDGERQPDRAMARAVDEELHAAIGAAAGNRTMEAIIAQLRRRTQMFDLRSMPERLESTCREHLAILRALASGDGAAAAGAMREHLDGVRGSIVARLTGR